MQIFGLRRAARAAALFSVLALLAGCCCAQYGRSVPRTRVIPDTAQDVPNQGRSFKSTRGMGITDDIVEVYREQPPMGPELVAAYLLRRPSSNSAFAEHWMLKNGEGWPLDMSDSTWLQTSMTDATVDDLCTFYGPLLGWGITPAPIYEVNYTNTSESSSSCPPELP